MTIAQVLPAGHVLNYTELSSSCCKWGSSNYFLLASYDEANSTSKLTGTKGINTNHLLEGIWMRKSFIHWQKKSFYYFRSYTSFAREGRRENLTYKKPHFIYPSSSYHIGYTPFTVDTVGSDKCSNVFIIKSLYVMILHFHGLSHRCGEHCVRFLFFPTMECSAPKLRENCWVLVL